MAGEDNAIGEYLRARRDLVTPEAAGIPVHGPRRVPGLRREELAMLAGISADYYLRLERGRERHPSPQVLSALARALRLDDVAEQHLLDLAAPRPRRPRPARVERAPEHLRDLVALLPVPAFVEGRWSDVLAANPLATALSPRLAVGLNRLRSFFLDPDERAFHTDWEGDAQQFVAAFRALVGAEEPDARAVELVGELSIGSPEFRRLWARHDVRQVRSSAASFDHPLVGPLRLRVEKLTTPEGLVVVIYHAEPGSDSADRLALLGAMSAEPASPRTSADRDA